MLGALKPEVKASYEQQIPVGRIGQPEDVAHAVLFLASDEAAFVSGTTIIVDGGQILPEGRL
jgi:3-oxoacyl-[acyl-carrier protein] reductase